MGPRTTRVLAVVGATAILVVGVNAVAYAATGKSLLLGKTNKASKTTTIQNSKSGAALSLKTKSSSSAPLKVNGKGKVVNLNADKVDGLDGTTISTTANSALAKANAATTAANDITAIRYRDTALNRSDDTEYNLGTVPAGTYSVNMNAQVILGSATPADPETLQCWLWAIVPSSGNNFLGEGTSVKTGNTGSLLWTGVSFSTVVQLNGTEQLRLKCATTDGTGWSTDFIAKGKGPNVSFIRLDGLSDRTPTI